MQWGKAGACTTIFWCFIINMQGLTEPPDAAFLSYPDIQTSQELLDEHFCREWLNSLTPKDPDCYQSSQQDRNERGKESREGNSLVLRVMFSCMGLSEMLL